MRPLPSGRRAPVPSFTPEGLVAGEVGDVVLGRVHDPVLLVQIDHGRLDIGVAPHGLDLSNRGAMFQSERGRRTGL